MDTPKNSFFSVRFQDKEVEIQFFDGLIYSKVPLPVSTILPDEKGFYVSPIEYFFRHCSPATITFLRDEERYAAEDIERIRKATSL